MQVDAMKLIAAAFVACRDGLTTRQAWLTAARAALEASEESGKMRVAVDITPDSQLSWLLSGPPGRRSDGPWTDDERALLELIRAGLDQCDSLLAAPHGAAALSQIGAVMVPLPGALRGGRMGFDPRRLKHALRGIQAHWHLLTPRLQELMLAAARRRPPLPRRR